jgi:site-specific recombinase XerD
MRQGVRRLKDIKVVTKPNGKQYIYRRVKGGFVKLPNLPENHPTFLAAYAAAEGVELAPKARNKAGSIAALCTQYLSSGEYMKDSPGTRSVRRRIVDKISLERGAGMIHDLRSDHIRKDVRSLTPGAASNRLKAWRAMLRFAVDEGLIDSNPARDVSAPKSVTISHHQWTPQEIEMFRAYWPIGTPQRTAMEVIYWTGARCVDAVRLGTQMVKDGWLNFVQSKTGGPATCPINNLPEWCRGLSDDHTHFIACVPSDRIQWIVTETGKPRSIKGLSQWMSRIATEAGLPTHCTAHGLRAARAAALAEIGATTHQIGAWTGHVSLAEIAHYTRAADQISILSGGEQSGNLGNRIEKFPKKSN